MYYKTEKERYRQEREERRKEKERIAALRHKVTASPEHQSEAKASTPTVVQETPAPAPPPPPEPRPKTPVITLPVSQAHGRYPEFEMYSVPKRHNTHLGHAHPTRRPSNGETHARSLSRITKRLADMGFTENAYPSLPSKIRANLNPERLVHKDSEDDIVTTLLEEMLATSPKSPKPSGSRGPPGGWD
ncbi:hypothetical protein ONZ45_g6542 [Pleurotus djamor]|nr:hypothetical protein ONZ45_g6542 [Pleurotus djamor]